MRDSPRCVTGFPGAEPAHSRCLRRVPCARKACCEARTSSGTGCVGVVEDQRHQLASPWLSGRGAHELDRFPGQHVRLHISDEFHQVVCQLQCPPAQERPLEDVLDTGGVDVQMGGSVGPRLSSQSRSAAITVSPRASIRGTNNDASGVRPGHTRPFAPAGTSPPSAAGDARPAAGLGMPAPTLPGAGWTRQPSRMMAVGRRRVSTSARGSVG